jgi:membrane protein
VAVIRVLRRSVSSLIATAGTRDAAQVAYFLVMSFPAILLLLVWGFSTVLDDPSVRQKIVNGIVDVLPVASPSDRKTVQALLDEIAAGAGGLGWVSIVGLLYAASGAIGALRYAVNDAWGERDTRPFVKGKALDAGVTLVAGPVLIIALGLILSGTLAGKIGDHPWLAAVAQVAVTRVLPLVLLYALLAWLFHLLPSPRAPWGPAAAGALVGLVGILAVQLGYGAYLALVGDSNAVYGTLGILLGLVFSAYLVGVALIFAAHVSAQVAQGRSSAM